MIKVHFYDYGCGTLDVEKELGITENAEEFFAKEIPGLEVEADDCAYDMDDNLIIWYSANDEEQCMQKIQDIIKAHLSSQSHMQYTVRITSEYSWYD